MRAFTSHISLNIFLSLTDFVYLVVLLSICSFTLSNLFFHFTIILHTMFNCIFISFQDLIIIWFKRFLENFRFKLKSLICLKFILLMVYGKKWGSEVFFSPCQTAKLLSQHNFSSFLLLFNAACSKHLKFILYVIKFTSGHSIALSHKMLRQTAEWISKWNTYQWYLPAANTTKVPHKHGFSRKPIKMHRYSRDQVC